MKTVLFFLTTLSLMACPALADTYLTTAEIKKLAKGTYKVSVADSVSAVVVLSGGGGISVVTNKGERDTGKWIAVDNKICVTFKRMLDHQTKCSKLTYDGSVVRGTGFSARR